MCKNNAKFLFDIILTYLFSVDYDFKMLIIKPGLYSLCNKACTIKTYWKNQK